MFRRLTGTVQVEGTDHEDFGPNERVNALRDVGLTLEIGEPTERPLNIAPVKWGGECRVEVHANALALDDGRVQIQGVAIFFEGASEDTGEEEDRAFINFVVPRTTFFIPNPFVVSFDLRNRTFIGGEDFAKVTFSLSNNILET
jgi:hypothetical protein